ncbi:MULTISPECIES: hemolysin XhlA family protein [Lactiplantibacillus]|uniref:Hemolysin XhlA family protein n=1 Tax=Lactiplantibacillus pentosus TaxID=1589 RepID=A0AAW8WJF9_LACPE|nr:MULTISPECIES: hemolysin XhlA family protein [Lactiplantibacillus]MBU7461183.1 hemolysin XhlA family protein [Lactiplantibacillus pentosus]MBU7476975.1 hemolysin XhlA family protein [Lactiplantibacillus pentosus]MBU7483899.1 hemolysin XhlA family protein [Lactiplantibacillus sp. 30.2.29]MBU7487082.1 hemolysin XhlA family protein [Lactiplantibacillus pentosus]MBU7500221.1 hemolysin XhlA family protein [Lactiplantibacillus pentosus]
MAQGDISDETRLLMEIKENLGRLNQKFDDMGSIDEKVNQALASSNENSRRIDRLTAIQNWLISVLVGGGLITLLVYIAEKFI